MLLYLFRIPKNGSDGLFTDNISETYWKRKGETTEKGYTFNYDKINRLKDANGVNFNYEEKGIDYDNNGNISQLTRSWKGANMDNLTYTYDGNKLATLQDANADGSGRGVKTGTFTYAGGDYDQNGNQLRDPAKNVTNIQYNYLDLPQTVSVNGKTLTYAYDASGEKQVYQNGLTETIYYAGAAEYNTTGQLSRIATGEGMIYPSMKSGNQIFQYQYYLSDHLGNNRVLFNDRGDTLQNTDYYPYGLAITNKSLFGGQRYLYNGKEVQTETNEYDFGARFYDPSTGRWHTMDPMSQFNSPYDYVGGNPINMIDPNGMYGEGITGMVNDIVKGMGLIQGVTVTAGSNFWGQFGQALGRFDWYSIGGQLFFDKNLTAQNASGLLPRGAKYEGSEVHKQVLNTPNNYTDGTYTFNGYADGSSLSELNDVIVKPVYGYGGPWSLSMAQLKSGFTRTFAHIPLDPASSRYRRDIAEQTAQLTLNMMELGTLPVSLGEGILSRGVTAAVEGSIETAAKGVNVAAKDIVFSTAEKNALTSATGYSRVRIIDGTAVIDRFGMFKGVSNTQVNLIKNALKNNGATSVKIYTNAVNAEMKSILVPRMSSGKGLFGLTIEKRLWQGYILKGGL